MCEIRITLTQAKVGSFLVPPGYCGSDISTPRPITCDLLPHVHYPVTSQPEVATVWKIKKNPNLFSPSESIQDSFTFYKTSFPSSDKKLILFSNCVHFVIVVFEPKLCIFQNQAQLYQQQFITGNITPQTWFHQTVLNGCREIDWFYNFVWRFGLEFMNHKNAHTSFDSKISVVRIKRKNMMVV